MKVFEDTFSKRENYVLGTLKIIEESTSPATWHQIRKACSNAMPILKQEIEMNFSNNSINSNPSVDSGPANH